MNGEPDCTRSVLEAFLNVGAASWANARAAACERALHVVTNARWELRKVADRYYGDLGLHVDLYRDPRLRAKPEWIPERPVLLRAVDARKKFTRVSPEQEKRDLAALETARIFPSFTSATTDEAQPVRDSARKVGYAGVLRASLTPALFDGVSYRLIDVRARTRSEEPQLVFSLGSYFCFLDTCEVSAYLLALERERRWALRPAPRSGHALLRPSKRERAQLLDLGSRHALVGVNCLILAHELRGSGSVWRTFLHTRSGKVAESRGTLHVLPAGTFQPDGWEVGDEKQFSLVRTVLRELFEETQGRSDLARPDTAPHDFLASPPGAEVYDLVMRDELPIWYLGLAVDPISAKPEMLCAIVMDGAKPTIKPLLEAVERATNEEGDVRPYQFTRDVVGTLLQDPRLLPAAMGCLRLARRHLRQLTATVGTVPPGFAPR